ncbi:MAG: hypothetical protein [Caudoviricetes sp.]|nr:MAG: hypothetical protein [Caudoviricetes sp.]
MHRWYVNLYIATTDQIGYVVYIEMKQKGFFNMFTKDQYMKHECTHEEFYGQFVTPHYISVVKSSIGIDNILKSTDEHFNDIPLKKWDMIARYGMDMKMDYNKIKSTGGVYSLSTFVCILKQAARVIKCENSQ